MLYTYTSVFGMWLYLGMHLPWVWAKGPYPYLGIPNKAIPKVRKYTPCVVWVLTPLENAVQTLLNRKARVHIVKSSLRWEDQF